MKRVGYRSSRSYEGLKMLDWRRSYGLPKDYISKMDRENGHYTYKDKNDSPTFETSYTLIRKDDEETKKKFRVEKE